MKKQGIDKDTLGNIYIKNFADYFSMKYSLSKSEKEINDIDEIIKFYKEKINKVIFII